MLAGLRNSYARFSRFVSEEYLQTFTIMLSMSIFAFFATKDYFPGAFKLAMPLVLVALVFDRDRARQFVWCLLLAVLMTLSVLLQFYTIANHGFVIAYLATALVIAFACPDDEKGAGHLRWFCLVMLSLLMGLALIQKLTLTYYMQGNLIGSYVMQGEMFQVALSLVIPDWADIAHRNRFAQATLLEAGPATMTAVAVSVPLLAKYASLFLTYVALLAQFLLELALLLHRRLGIWLHVVLIGFVLVIYASRNENVFLSLNCLTGYGITNDETKAARKWYVALAVYLLSMELFAVRPIVLL